MGKIIILGAGVMGSALASVAAANNEVTLVGSPLDDSIIDGLKLNHTHSGLQLKLPVDVVAVKSSDINDAIFANADVVVLGVSSPGVDWALNIIQRHKAAPRIVALVTKGLVTAAHDQGAPRTYAQTIDKQLTNPAGAIVGIGGPCIARELALGYPTRVCFASEDLSAANQLRDLLKTEYYHITTHTEFTGLEACAALKNFMCIGVSAMLTAYTLDDGYAKNPIAGLFNQAVHEIATLSDWIKRDVTSPGDLQNANELPKHNPAFDLAGLGDLHVTVGGGRNSRLGQYLGTGRLLSEILQSDMHNVTVEGVDTGKQLLPGFRAACANGNLNPNDVPLTSAILTVINDNQPFKFEFNSLPG